GGRIVSADGQGVDFADAAGSFVTRISNLGSIASQTNDGVRIGSTGQIENAGTISGGKAPGYSDGADGIQFEDGASGWVINKAGGHIAADRHAINAGEDSQITVVNEAGATLLGRNGSGVGSDGSATVINHGTITGAFSDSEGSDTHGATPGEDDGGAPDGVNDGDGDGVDVDFYATIENFGVIQGTGAGGTGSDGLPNSSEGVAAGGGVITNHAGATIFGAGSGVLVDDSSQGDAPFLTEIVNDGTISGGDGFGIRIVSALGDTIVNGGSISGGGGVAIEFGSGDNTLFLEDGSTIDGLSIGGAGSDTLDYSRFSQAVSVDLLAKEADGTDGVSQFENVVGSAQADKLAGSGADNILDGGAGADRLVGRGGDDVYRVDDQNDVVVEKAGGGFDTVVASTSYRIAAGQEIERLELSDGAAGDGLALRGNGLANSLLGNGEANVLIGGNGADTLDGGAGADALTGGKGADVFDFSVTLGRGEVDRITDFEVGRDTIELDHAVFAGLDAGALSAAAFTTDTLAREGGAQVIYDRASGALLFDADGAGDADKAVKFAEVAAGLQLTHDDFLVT
ncbi:MAG: calcium-binding protein, partial [Hansschlegelia sp.]